MYSIDRMREPDYRLRCLAGIFALGLMVLAGGLWYLQVVSFSKYEEFREVQSYRTVRVPASRGKILDRHGIPLADNQPNYQVALYLEELRPLFRSTYKQARERYGSLTVDQRSELERLSRYSVVSNICFQVSQAVSRPMTLARRDFERHYGQKLYVPLPLAERLSDEEVARFVERGSHIPGVDLEFQSLRTYPHGSLGAHLLGYVRKSDPKQDESAQKFSYHQTDFKGVAGLEYLFDESLKGEHGGKSILINNLMYRQDEHTWFPSIPGDNLYLTLDARIQQAAEAALVASGPKTRGAIIVMDVNNGDLLAMASAPTYDPNVFNSRLSRERYNELFIRDEAMKPLLNRATYGVYAPGSIFKIVTGLSCLEDGGLDPAAKWSSLGYYSIGSRFIRDTAGAGEFDFNRAFAKSSNPYFIHFGLDNGIRPLIKWGERFFLGHATGLLPGQERSGSFPTIEDVNRGWADGETANLCIGQGAIAVTPLQMAVMVSAVANGGTVYQPRIAARLEPQSREDGRQGRVFSKGVVRGKLGASPESIQVLHEAMLVDVAGDEGSGRAAQVPGLNIGGKTGTAETNKRINGRKIKDTWFASFAPVENPKYAVLVLVVDGISGKTSCAPLARLVYEVLKDLPDLSEVTRSERTLATLRPQDD